MDSQLSETFRTLLELTVKMRRDIALMMGYSEAVAARSVSLELMTLKMQVGGHFPELDALLEEFEEQSRKATK